MVVTSSAIRVDPLFVDEGFGSLSAEVLDTAMRTLDNLKQGGRTIGLISHVEKMQEDIASKIKVTKTPRGPSLIHQVDQEIAGMPVFRSELNSATVQRKRGQSA